MPLHDEEIAEQTLTASRLASGATPTCVPSLLLPAMMEIERSGGDPAVVFKERSFAEAEREIEEWTERNCA